MLSAKALRQEFAWQLRSSKAASVPGAGRRKRTVIGDEISHGVRGRYCGSSSDIVRTLAIN